jgi:NifU-like protein
MWEYSERLKDHFFNPRNVGAIENPSGVGEVGSLACGDALKLYLKVDAKGVITDARFQTFGCGSAIASASALTEMVKGKTVAEAARITNQDIAEYLGGIPPEKMHCSVMGREALEAAIANCRGEAPPGAAAEIVCKCFGVSEDEILRTIREENLHTVQEVTNYTKAGGGCGKCHGRIQVLIRKAHGQKPVEPAEEGRQAGGRLSNFRRMKLIEETVEREIRPALVQDGGDIEIQDIDGARVVVALRGACAHCPSSGVTLAQYVQAKLREIVDRDITVEEAV